jgi:hypothetical protein
MQWIAAEAAEENRRVLTMTGFSRLGRRKWVMAVQERS